MTTNTRRIFYAPKPLQGIDRDNASRHPTEETFVPTTIQTSPLFSLARIRFSNNDASLDRKSFFSYLGDGGTEEGVGRSLTNHTYRSFVRRTHSSVNQSLVVVVPPEVIQSIRRIRVGIHRLVTNQSSKPKKNQRVRRCPILDVPYASLPKDGAPSSPPLEFLRTMVAPRRAVVVVVVVVLDTAMVVVVLFTWASMLSMMLLVCFVFVCGKVTSTPIGACWATPTPTPVSRWDDTRGCFVCASSRPPWVI